MPAPGSAASATKPVLDPKVARVYMIPLKEDGTFDDDLERAFQYWPETLTDSRGDSGWQEKVVPGGSHPLVQWTAGGGRRLSFSVFFGRDEHPAELEDENEDNVDIAAALAWLRYYTYPLYEQNSVKVVPPPALLLVFPNTELGYATGGGDQRGIDEVLCVMTSCDITYHAWFPNGTPRIVEASLEFLEIVQVGAGSIIFHSRDSLLQGMDFYTIRKQDK